MAATPSLRKARVQPNSRPAPGPIGNAPGIVFPATEVNTSGASDKPSIAPETPKEKSFWDRWGETVHTVLDIGGAIPVVGVFSDGINAAIYTAEGNYVQAGISGVSAAANLIPGGGAAVKGGKLAIKGGEALLKAEAKVAAKEAARLATKKAEKEAAEQLAKKAEKEAVEKAAKKKAEEGAHVKGPKKRGPCDHLKKGDPNGKGEYRGGSYGGTKQPGIESHHAPADSKSPLPKSQGPAAQMDPTDHRATSSHGHQGADGARYRAEIEALLKAGKWREAMAKEIDDLRRVAKEAGDPKKYNQAIKEMLGYFKCMSKHGLLS